MTAREQRSFRWWYLPSWLGLDAPCVVTTWCFAIARATHQQVALKSMAVLFLVVWSIYLVDRMIDVSRCSDWSHVSGRMQFGRRFRWLFGACLAGCVIGLMFLLASGIPMEVVWRGIFVVFGMAMYFALFVLPIFFREKLPGKEFGVGLFFALGCYCVLGMQPRALPMFVGVAVVVAYNCLVIAARDRDVDHSDRGAASRWWRNMDRDLTFVGAGLLTIYAAMALLGDAPWFYTSLATASLLLTLLHRRASYHSPDAVRAWADFCLFTPWLAMLLI